LIIPTFPFIVSKCLILSMTHGNKPRHGFSLPLAIPRPVILVNIMAKPLTAKAIENIKPGAVRREIPDEVRGLYLQVFPSGKASWAFRYRFGGRTRKLTIGPSPEISLKDARDLARKAHGTIGGGKDPAEQKQVSKVNARTPADRDIVEKVAAQFLARHVKGLSVATQREVNRIMAKDILPTWSGRRLSQIGKSDIHELLDRIVDRGATVQANRALAWIKGMCNFAIGRGLIEVSPCAGIRPPTAETARDRVLSDDELRAVWEAADALAWPYRGVVQLLVLTGQRRNEVTAMTWRELDLDARIWTLPAARAKNGVEHQIPLPDLAVEILKACPRIDGSDFVFTISGRNPMMGHFLIKRRLDSLMAPDTPPWVLHDIRRTVASGMARLGVNLSVVEKLLNHVGGSFSGVAGVYQRHSFADEKRAAMTAWARHVEVLVTGETGANIVPIRA
jgi:integrase